MSIEVTFFLLRLLIGLSLAGFLLMLFFIIWRSIKQTESEIRSARQHHGRLVIVSEADDETAANDSRFLLLPITTLGRSASNQIVVNDDFASAEHARIVLKERQWWLEDRRSRNGTHLNGQAIGSPIVLTDGDVIGIGKYQYRLELNS